MAQAAQDSVKQLIARRGQLYGKLTRFENYVNKIDAMSEPIQIELQTRLDMTLNISDDFDTIQTELESVALDTDTEQQHAEEREKFETRYFSLISKAKYLLKQQNSITTISTPSVDSVSGSNAQFNLKLPQLNLPEFSGAYEKWTQFKDSFESLINKNPLLTNIQRFYYLQAALKGEACKVLSSLSVSDANYETAWKLLTERYENKKAIIHSHVKAIFELSSINKDAHSLLRIFLDDFLSHYRSLENLGEGVEHWHTVLIYLLTTKLDNTSRREWEIHSRNDDSPTMDNFIAFLTQRCKVLETMHFKSPHTSAPYKRPIAKSLSYVSSASNQISCPLCSNTHHIYNCNKFVNMPVNRKFQEVRRMHLCTNCLRSGHSNSECKSQNCKTCNKKHNTLLHSPHTEHHETNQNNKNTNARVTQHPTPHTRSENAQYTQHNAHNNTNISDTKTYHSQAHIVDNHPSSGNLSINSHCSHANPDSLVLLSTALVLVNDSMGNPVTCRALLDSGSQSSFITQKMHDRLNTPTHETKIPISGINQQITYITKRTNLTIKSRCDNFTTSLPFLVINRITNVTPQITFDRTLLNIPTNVALADGNFHKPSEVDMLLGANIFYDLLCVGKINLGRGLPNLHKTKLGWIVTGQMNSPKPTKPSCLLTTNADLHEQLQRFWCIEEQTSSSPRFSREEQEVEDHFLNTFSRDDAGRFTVKLPLRKNYQELGESSAIAIMQFYSLERKLSKNSHQQEEYVKFMTEYESLGHMSEVSQVSQNTISYYMPHHGIQREDSLTTKYRVVFNASSPSTSGISLNNVLKVGPTIQQDLFSIILRFRKHNYVMTGDIAKMYRQINLQNSQRDLQRIVWRPSPDVELKHFQLNTVTYGTAPASFLATRCLKQLSSEFARKFPVECDIIANDFYMDDLLTGSTNVANLVNIRKNLVNILKSGCFELRKFTANDPLILKDIAEYDDNITNFIITEDKVTKTLGIKWNSATDCFAYDSRQKISRSEKITKRTILSSIAQIFDPLGLLSPIIINAKLLLQSLWKLGLDWDESVSTECFQSWCRFQAQIASSNELVIPRQVTLKTYSRIQIHGFCDASERAYGACIYIRSENSDNINVQLLCAKSRLAPLKSVSLPRLELCGALLLSELMHKAINALQIPNIETCYWTDSTIVLSWLSLEPTNWKVFVRNRVAEIQNLSQVDHWYHISTLHNPADLISRGLNPKSSLLNQSLWWNGPSFLSKSESSWPQDNHISQFSRSSHDVPEVINLHKVHTFLTLHEFDIFNKYSTLTKLQRIFAYCLRFIGNMRNPSKQHGELTSVELDHSLAKLIQISQAQSFPQDLLDLKRAKSVKPVSSLKSLNPYLDDKNLIRVGGRLEHSELLYTSKHPVIISDKHPLTRLITQHEHIRNLHSGVQGTLSAVRQNYWPLKGRRTVRNIVNKCILCFKANPVSNNQLMGALPSTRTVPSPPFTVCGVDYAGPFQIKDGKLRNRRIIKSYVCIFVCFSTKAIHIELVTELSTECFLNAFKRFISRRGLCKQIYSDNASNFVGANNVLQQIINLTRSTDFQNYFAHNSVQWHFIPSRSPHMGGIWEASVRTVKHHLKRVSKSVHFTFEEFYTLLTRIEAILNSRPLVPMSDDPNDLEPITPGHFLIGRPLNSASFLDTSFNDYTPRSRYEHLAKMSEHFWSRWSREYLHTLQQRSKWRFQKDNAVIGSLVILKEDNTAVCMWPLGRITATHPGKDGVVRVVSVKTKGGVVKRAINKICMLPLDYCPNNHEKH